MNALGVGWSVAALIYLLGVVDRWTDLSQLGGASAERRAAERPLAVLLVLGWPLIAVVVLAMRAVPAGRR